MPDCVSKFDAWWDWARFDHRRLWTPRFVGSFPLERAVFITLFLRTILAGYIFAEVIFDRATSRSDDEKYLSYLTVHGIILVAVYFLGATLIGWVVYSQRNSPTIISSSSGAGLFLPSQCKEPHMLKYAWIGLVRATQLIWSLALTYQLIIVVLYWVLLAQNFSDPVEVYKNVESHGMKFAYIWADYLFLSSNRLVDKHGLFVLLSGFAYLLWNIQYTFTRGPWVYPVLTWRGPGSAILAVGTLAFVMIVYYLIAMPLGMVRDKAAARVNGIDRQVLSTCACCSTDLLPLRAPFSAERAALYPLHFLDEKLALPCSSCTGCSASTRERSPLTHHSNMESKGGTGTHVAMTGAQPGAQEEHGAGKV